MSCNAQNQVRVKNATKQTLYSASFVRYDAATHHFSLSKVRPFTGERHLLLSCEEQLLRFTAGTSVLMKTITEQEKVSK